MEKLKEQLTALGISKIALDGMGVSQLKHLGKAMNLNVSELTSSIKIEKDRNGARYVATGNYAVPMLKDNKIVEGKMSVNSGIHVRVEAIDQLIKDLQKAKKLLK